MLADEKPCESDINVLIVLVHFYLDIDTCCCNGLCSFV